MSRASAGRSLGSESTARATSSGLWLPAGPCLLTMSPEILALRQQAVYHRSFNRKQCKNYPLMMCFLWMHKSGSGLFIVRKGRTCRWRSPSFLDVHEEVCHHCLRRHGYGFLMKPGPSAAASSEAHLPGRTHRCSAEGTRSSSGAACCRRPAHHQGRHPAAALIKAFAALGVY